MRFPTLTAFCVMIPAAAFAVDIPDGTYDTVSDGATGTLSLAGGRGEFSIAGQGCLGNVEGPVEMRDDVMTLTENSGGMSCTISFTDSSTGIASIAQGQGCTMFHGASCAFSGQVIGRAVPFSVEAIQQGFGSFTAFERQGIQQTLKDQGLYDMTIDGQAGPGNVRAIRESARAGLVDGTAVTLDTLDGSVAFMASLIPTAATAPVTTPAVAPVARPEAAIGNLPFVGAWACRLDNGDDAAPYDQAFTLEPDALTHENVGQTTRYAAVKAVGTSNTAFVMSLTDGREAFIVLEGSNALYIAERSASLECQKQ